MSIVKNSQLIKEAIHIRFSDKEIIDEKTAKFIIERYFHYGIISMMHGYSFASQMRFAIKLNYILYSDIPTRLRKMFTYSSKIFGYTFLPVLANNKAKKCGYNLKPNKKVLDAIAEFVETDKIYNLTKR